MISIKGPLISISLSASDNGRVVLPDGYTLEKIIIYNVVNILSLNGSAVRNNYIYVFPPVNSKSPNYLDIKTSSEGGSINIGVMKFGQIPDSHYFDSPFTPILVTGEDGNEYNVIPSNQFK